MARPGMAASHFHVLGGIALYDHMSNSRGAGQGCWASNKTLATKCGVNYTNLGDIVLADLLQYRIVQASPRFALSADVAFLTDELAFRLVLRMDGMPAYASAVTPFNGSNITRSPFVTLDARS